MLNYDWKYLVHHSPFTIHEPSRRPHTEINQRHCRTCQCRIFFNTKYYVVDIYFVGMISTEMVAALPLTFPMFFIVIAIEIGIDQGTTALIANAS